MTLPAVKTYLPLALAALAITGCSQKTTPLGEAGVCYHVTPPEGWFAEIQPPGQSPQFGGLRR